jgi:hypothetical protein
VKCSIDRQVVLLRAPEGRLAAYIGPFAGSLREQGYSGSTGHDLDPALRSLPHAGSLDKGGP